MSKNTSNPIKTNLVLAAADRGGPGKTTSVVLASDYLAANKRSWGPIECDLANCTTPAGFSHWFSEPINRLDLSCVDDCDTLLRQSSQSGLEYVVVDLPANSSADLVDWLDETATPSILKALGLRIIALCPVDQSSGAPEIGRAH